MLPRQLVEPKSLRKGIKLKTFNKTIIAALLSIGATAFAAPVTVNVADNYVGGGDNVIPARDVIGPAAELEIHGMDVTIDRATGTLSVQINTNWYDSDLSGDDGHEYHVNTGDLFISTNGWAPTGGAPYDGDNADNGEVWEYVFDTDTGSIYGGNFSILRTQDEMGGPLLPAGETENWYRDNQESRYGSGGTQSGSGTVTWSVGVGFIRYNLLLSDLGLASDELINLGLHWTMTCGNDVIEGGVVDEGGGGGGGEVPEPGTLLLAGLGLIGIGLSRKRK